MYKTGFLPDTCRNDRIIGGGKNEDNAIGYTAKELWGEVQGV